MTQVQRAPGVEVSVFGSPGAVADAVAETLAQLAQRRPGAVVLLAGGKTPAAAYARCGALGVTALDLWFTDERMVGPDDPDSNYRMIAHAWLNPAGVPADAVHRIEGELGATAAAAACSRAWRARPRVPAVALLGLGADGHTASLFPGDPACAQPGAFIPAQAGRRVSASHQLLSSADQAWFVVTGADKAERLAELCAPASTAHARRLVTCQHIKVFCDTLAAGRLPVGVNAGAALGH